ncbi:hypothetical protein DL93DRAFT_285265 [Clavulina sp. PMI_390]|nr:hypothetical protein DL93DRAFT_285265 [Clavulina sp. PMI_390]
MPKASPTSTTKERVKPPQPSSHLGRNQACHQCRRRKLRCDAARPCGPCLKYHAGIIASRAIKGEVFDLTPSCTYDDNTGIPPPAEPTPQAIPSLTPNSSAGGGQFANHHYPYTTQNGLPGSLPNLSYPVPSSASTPSPDAPGIMRQGSLPGHAGVPLADGVQFFQPMVGGSSSLAGLNYSFNQSQHQYSFGPLDMPLATNAPFDISASPTTPFGPSPTTPFPPYLHASSSTSSIPSFTPAPEASYLHQSSSSALPSHTSLPPQPSVSSHPPPPYQQYTQTQTQEVIPASYPAQLPPPALLDHLLDLFFSKVPFGDRLVHRPSFMAAVRQHPPSSPSYPSSSLLHAICAIASVYSPIIEQHVRASRTEPGRSWFEYFTHADEIELEAPGAEGAGAPGGSGEGSPGGAARRKQGIFGTEQASIARVLALFDLRTGKRVFDTVRTMICLIWYYP